MLAEAVSPCDFVFRSVNGYDTMDAIDQLATILKAGTILGSFQNGVGNEETIAAAMPDQALLAGSFTLPVSLDEPGLVHQHSRRGGVALAPVSPEVNVGPLVRKLTDTGLAGIDVYHSEHMPEHSASYLDLARRLNLIVTGGSDFHGENKQEVRLGSGISGNASLPYSVPETILETCFADQ